MTDTTTDHAAAIRRHVQAVKVLTPATEDDDSAFTEAYYSHLDDIEADADALAAQIVEAEKRVERWKRWYTTHECPPCNICGDPDEWMPIERIDAEHAAWNDLKVHGDLDDPQEAT